MTQNQSTVNKTINRTYRNTKEINVITKPSTTTNKITARKKILQTKRNPENTETQNPDNNQQ